MGTEATVCEMAQALLAGDRFLILTHRRPDGDTLGCASALCRGLRMLGKTAYILPNPELTPRYAPLITPFYPQEPGYMPRCVVSVDIADTGLFPEPARQYAVDLSIDHHRANPCYAARNLVDPSAGACAEIIFDVLTACGVQMTEALAEPLYVAVSTDTGCFRYSNTTPRTHTVAAACLATGFDGGVWNRILFETKTKPRFAMERILFETLEFFEDGKIALATIHRADIEHTGATPDDLDSIASLPRQIEGVQIGLTLTENKDGTCKASVRTTKEVDASRLCAKCGGGGHLRAAGASFVSLKRAREMLLTYSQAVYHDSND